MTVLIASRRGIWADSQVTCNAQKFRASKILRHKRELIGLAGDNRAIEAFLHWYAGKRHTPLKPVEDSEFGAVVVSRKGVAVFGNCSLPDYIRDDYAYLGVGAIAAEAAMKAGADPRRAIEIACEVVEGCGLPVQEETL